ncbi:ead/Ea22-like family protein [Enterobacter hormaechei]|uniref:ead/Ea22-like family protein n=1 Tax=Enterobacter hormaechei TaxID=158836 RepID=UPI00118473AF|nr:ead/Ea22-like family protein [Enterobacter hormaechei]TSD18053.1 ead/Ea22-like family protein [Enterobacter hormaechei]TSD24239.1 ead/Ea22-like family protein [Enterobacter hormaechei]
MSNIDKRALREAAEKATPGNWWIDSHGQAMVSFIENDVLEVFATDNKRAAVRHEDTGNLSRWRNDNDATFIATADPATVLALLDELEAAEKKTVEMPTFDGYVPHVARELHAAFRIACDNAGINVTAACKGEAS